MILPNQTFFRPTRKFVAWLKEYAKGRLVIDCGAGQGFFAKKMRDAGISVLALDINERDETFTEIVRSNCDAFDFPRRSLPIFARPSHGSWVWDVVHRAMNDWGTRRAEAVLYVGKESNVERDLDLRDPSFRIKQLGKNCGRDREGVWEITHASKVSLEDWALVKTTSWKHPSWVEDGGKYWINLQGGRCPKRDKDKILQRVRVPDYHSLDWSLTALGMEKDPDAGWLEPDGKFHGCGSRAHDRYADLVLHSTPDALDKMGWVRVYSAPGMSTSWTGGKDWICVSSRPTDAQIKWLEARGHEVTDYDRGMW